MGSVKRLAYSNFTTTNVWQTFRRAPARVSRVTAQAEPVHKQLTLDQAADTYVMAGRDDGGGGRDARRGRTGVTLEDVARAAGVAYSTVFRGHAPATVPRADLAPRQDIQALARQVD